MKKNFVIILALSLSVFYVSCGGGKNYRLVMGKPEKLFYSKKYKQAADALYPYASKADKNQLLYMMEAGYMFHVAADYKKSNGILLKAGKIAKIVPLSISKQVASLLTNQRATNYKGEDFEIVLIHMYAGLNFLMLKDYDSARVEFKRVNQELSKIKVEGKARYKQNLMAKYLTAIAYEISAAKNRDEHDLEFAFIEYKQIRKLFPRLAMVRSDLNRVDKQIENPNRWNQKNGELVVVYQAGKTAIKKSRGGLLDNPNFKARIYVSFNGISAKQGVTIGAIIIALKNAENPIPRFVKRSNLAKYVEIRVAGQLKRSVMLENIEQTAIQTLKDDYGRLKGKLAASIVTKAVVSIAAGLATKAIAKKMGAGAFSGLLGTVVGAGTAAALFSAMKPDLRHWHTLPANLQLTRLSLRPGNHIMELRYIGRGGRMLLSQKFKVGIKKGEKSFFISRTLN